MERIKRSWGLFSGFLALAALSGCMTGDDSKDSSTFSLTSELEVTEIETPDEEAGEPGVISTLSHYFYCSDEEVEEDETEGTMLYAISGGSLFLWSENACTAMKFTGSSSKIQGTWTSSDLSVRIPSAYRPLSCEGVSPTDNFLEEWVNDAVTTYTITSSKITSKASGTFCLAPLMGKAYKGNEDISVVSSGCSTVKLKHEDAGRTAALSASYKNDELTQTVAYNGKTCRLTHRLGLSNRKPNCSEEAADELEEHFETFVECLEDSEFIDDFGTDGILAKGKGKLPAVFEQALKRARPF